MLIPTSRWVLDFRAIAVFIIWALSFNKSADVPLRPKEMVSLLEDGKRQYNLIQAKSSMPSFGSCWRNAVTRLHSGCQHLDDRIQTDVALSFANCFLEGAGLPRHECAMPLATERETCLRNMPEKAFIAYTEFFTHTQSMCFFIMSQVWHEETEKTIDKLSTSAADVARQLEASEELQEELLLHQRKSVLIQQELLENGVSLGSMLHDSKNSLDLIFSEFQASTLEQQRLLSMVFHHLSALQSWIVGEVSWVDSIAFYLPSFAFLYFLTSAQRSSSARIPGLIVLLLAGLIERLISHVLLSDEADAASFQPIDVINERLSWWVWIVRRCAIIVNIGLLSITLYRYRNREEVMHQLLEQIRGQNEELLRHLCGVKKSNSNGMTTTSDVPDGLGYMPVLLTTSSPPSGHSTPRPEASPVATHIKPIARNFASTSGVVPIKRLNVAIPTANSAFKPIKEHSPNSSSATECSLDQSNQLPVSPVVIQSTPRTKSKRRTPLENASPATTRYNLRRSRNLAATPV